MIKFFTTKQKESRRKRETKLAIVPMNMSFYIKSGNWDYCTKRMYSKWSQFDESRLQSVENL